MSSAVMNWAEDQRINRTTVFLTWFLFSLLAIAHMGSRPHLGLAIAALGGAILGATSYLAHIPRRAGQKPASGQGAARRLASWAAEHELWWVAVPAGLIQVMGRLPLPWIAVSLLIFPFTWAVRWLVRGHLSKRTRLDTPILLLLLTTIVALYPSVDMSLTVPALFVRITGVGLFYSLVNGLRSYRRFWRAMGVLLAAGAGVALLGLANTSWVTSKVFTVPAVYDWLARLPFSLGQETFNRNIVGGTLSMLFPVYVGLFLFGPRLAPPWRVGLGLSAGLVGGTLFLTQSRGAIMGAIVALYALSVWRSRWMLLLTLPVAAGLVYTMGTASLRGVANFLLVSDTLSTAQGRLELWQRAMYMMQDFPYTGIGLGTFARVVPVLYPMYLIGPDTVVPHAHNLYLQMGVDLGLPGLVAFVGLVTAFGLTALSIVRRARGTHLESTAVSLSCGFVVYLIHGAVDHVTFSSKPATALWVIMGLTVALGSLLSSSSKASGSQ